MWNWEINLCSLLVKIKHWIIFKNINSSFLNHLPDLSLVSQYTDTTSVRSIEIVCKAVLQSCTMLLFGIVPDTSSSTISLPQIQLKVECIIRLLKDPVVKLKDKQTARVQYLVEAVLTQKERAEVIDFTRAIFEFLCKKDLLRNLWVHIMMFLHYKGIKVVRIQFLKYDILSKKKGNPPFQAFQGFYAYLSRTPQ